MMINPIFDGKRYILDNQMLRVIRALPNVDIFKNRLLAIEEEFNNNLIKEYSVFCNNNIDTFDKALIKACKLIRDYKKHITVEELNNNNKITVIDAIMGTGKTNYIIDEIINKSFSSLDEIEEYIKLGICTEKDKELAINNMDRFICVLPSLDECQRYKKQIRSIEIFEPDEKKGKGRKLEHLKDLIKGNKNIATTHALIKLIDEETIEYLRTKNYILIIDEELNVVDQYKDLSKKDIRNLHELGYFQKDEQGFLIWNEQDTEEKFRYDDVKRLCNLNCLMEYKNSNCQDIIIWNFPYTFFNFFKKCYICTYLWNGSIQKNYFDLHNIKYEHKTILDNVLVNYVKDVEYEKRRYYNRLINIYNGKLNVIGESIKLNSKGRPKKPLCKSWYVRSFNKYIDNMENQSKNNNELIIDVKNNTNNYFKNIVKGRAVNNMWTVFEGSNDSIRKLIKGDGYAQGFVPCNCKGTNKYINKTNLAYLIDMNISPVIIQFFKQHNITIDEDAYSLSMMLQWIWRSAIRNNNHINIYIPSERMRTLLIMWLNNEI